MRYAILGAAVAALVWGCAQLQEELEPEARICDTTADCDGEPGLECLIANDGQRRCLQPPRRPSDALPPRGDAGTGDVGPGVDAEVVCECPGQESLERLGLAAAECAEGSFVCEQTCAEGRMDADEDPANGCECVIEGEVCCEGHTRHRGIDIGVCESGLEICRNGQYVPFEGDPPVMGGPEICNGQDDDCDESTDEGDDGEPLTIPCGAEIERGECRPGVETCVDGEYGGCTGVTEAPEQCNGLDDDCDGTTDEDMPDCCGGVVLQEGETCCDGEPLGEGLPCCMEGDTRPCDGPRVINGGTCIPDEDPSLMQRCMGDNWTACPGVAPPASEAGLCNGLDDDCDGDVDEDFLEDGLGEVCSVGVGACRNEGVRVCNEDGNSLFCNAIELGGRQELCNGEDDDCDGMVDEPEGDLEPVPCGVRVVDGQCQEVEPQQCVEAAWTECAGEEPPTEVCDGVDNDCDGETDEGFGPDMCCDGVMLDAGQACCRGQVVPEEDACCEPGTWFSCGERLQMDSLMCEEVLVECLPNGQFGECPEPSPQVEVECDGLDENCDGNVDEGLAGCCRPVEDTFDCGPRFFPENGECDLEAFVTCNQDRAFPACPGEMPELTEMYCNGVDEDCDGVADDEFMDLGNVCFSGQGQCRTEGIHVCAGDGLGVECRVEDQPGPSLETCDFVDNDCDGEAIDPDCFPDVAANRRIVFHAVPHERFTTPCAEGICLEASGPNGPVQMAIQGDCASDEQGWITFGGACWLVWDSLDIAGFFEGPWEMEISLRSDPGNENPRYAVWFEDDRPGLRVDSVEGGNVTFGHVFIPDEAFVLRSTFPIGEPQVIRIGSSGLLLYGGDGPPIEVEPPFNFGTRDTMIIGADDRGAPRAMIGRIYWVTITKPM